MKTWNPKMLNKAMRRRIAARSLRIETLERRELLNVDWRNPLDSLDVNNDFVISPIDVLVLINDLNSRGTRSLPSLRNPAEPFLDTTGNQSVEPLDVLSIINFLNLERSGGRTLSDRNQFDTFQDITITLGQETGARIYRMEIDADFGAATSGSLIPDIFSVYLVDPINPSQTLLDRGENGTSLFALSQLGTEMALGLTRWDGKILEIDLSSVKDGDTGQLRVQLVNGNATNPSTISIRPLDNFIDVNRFGSTLFSIPEDARSSGPQLNLSLLTQTSSIRTNIDNVRLDSASGTLIAEVGIRNTGSSIGRDVALVLAGLPAGVTLSNASGTTTDGVPYLNLRNAIGSGGLGEQSSSNRVELQIQNPARQLFSIQPQVLVGVVNRSPTLAPIPAQTVFPGGHLRIPLNGTDLDNDRITYSLREVSGSATMPMGRLQSDADSLVFTPAPGDLGTYSFEVTASDGVLSTSQTFSLNVVADPIATTRISGTLLDLDESPIAGITVEIGSVQGLTQTDGSFALDLGTGPLIGDTIKVRGEQYVGSVVYPFIAEKLAFVLEHAVYANVNNVIHRPIYLPPLDVSNGMLINPTQDMTVTTPAIPGANVFVAAGTLMNQQGAPFSGVLSITEVPTSLTPAALPDNLRPDLVVTIQPGEMVFARPAPLSFPNRSGWAPGTRMDLWSINPVTGEFDDVGDMQVSADGSSIYTISGGVRNSSWHFPAPPPPDDDDPEDDESNSEDSCEECPKGTTRGNSLVELHSGFEIESHSLVSYMSQGVSRAWTLTYDSGRADPRPIVHFGFKNTQAFDNLKLVASVSIKRGDFALDVPGYSGEQYGLRPGDHIWSVSPDEADAKAALQADLRDAPSGRYFAQIRRGLMQFNGQVFTGTSVTSDLSLLHINTINGQFGAGWGLDGLKELVDNPDGTVLMIDGDGSESLFMPPSLPGQSYRSPPGTFSTLVKLPDQTFRLTSTDKMVYAFNSLNKLSSVTDRNGNATTFSYDVQGRLIRITDPVGLETSFAIDANGKVSQISDPANRITRFEYDSAGNLTRLVDPDATERNWQYDAEHRMTGEIDKRGNQEQTIYDFAGRVQSAVMTDGTIRQFEPLQVRNLLPPDATIDPLSPPFAFPKRQAIAKVADENGNVTLSVLDRAGQIVSSQDPAGQLPLVIRNNQNQVVQSFDGRGFVTLYEYDTQGNVVSVRDQESGGNQVVGAIATPDAKTVYTFVGNIGQSIYYDALPSNSDNLLVQLISPSGRQIFFNNDDSNNGPFLLNEAGEYRLELFGSNGALGDYAFNLFSPETQVAGLSLGSERAGTIRVPGEVDVFTFQGFVGQRLYYDALPSAADDLLVELISPTGQQIFFNNDDSNHGNIVLSEAGPYRLQIFGSGDAIGDYRFTLLEPSISIIPLSIGMEITGALTQPGEVNVFTFTGMVGQRVFYDALTSEDDVLLANLLSPTGEQLFFINDDANSGIVTLSEDGPYRLNLFGNVDTIGDYHFRMLEPSLSFTPLTLGSVVTGDIAQPGEVDVFTFDGTVGQRVYYDALASAADVLLAELRSPSGRQLFFVNDDSNSASITLDEAGPYRLNLFGNGDATGDYHFRLVEPSISITPLTLGSEVTGTLALPGEVDVFTFDGTVGQAVYYDALPSAADELLVDLIGPSGRQLFFIHDESNHGSITLDEAGAYRLNIFGNSDAIGDYHFRLLGLPGQPLQIGTTQAGQIVLPNGTIAFGFEGSQGQRLTFDGRVAGNANWFLYSSSSVFLGGNVGIGTDFTVTLPYDATYTLLLAGFDSANSVNYDFQVTDVSDVAVSLSGWNTPQSGTIAAGQTRTFTYDAPAGLSVFFNELSATKSTGLRAELRDPQNQQVFLSDDMTNRGPLVLSRSGTYMLRITGDAPTSTGSFNFTLMDLVSASTTIVAGETQTGVLSPFQLKAFVFEGTVGQRLFYDALDNDFDSVSSLMIAPTGATLFNHNADSDDGPRNLTESGTYKLLVVNNTAAASPNYSFRLLVPSLSTTDVAIGASISDQIVSPGDRKVYTFTGSVGQRIFYDSLQNDFGGGQRVQLLSPSGDSLFNNNQDNNNGPYTLLEAGTYRIVMSGDNDAVGTFQFRLLNPTFVSQPLSIGATITDQLVAPGDRKEYTFIGTVGQRIFYDALQSDFSIATRKQLFSPSGRMLFNNNTDNNDGPFTLTEAGIYRMLISGDNDAVGSFSFRMREPTYSSQSLQMGVTISDSLLNPGDRKEYTITGTVGQRIFYDALQSDFSIATRKQMFSPSGRMLFNNNTDSNDGPFTLTEAGIYRILISGDNDVVGTYSFRMLEPLFVSQSLTIGATVDDQLLQPGDRKEYSFTATIGQQLYFDSLQSDFSIATRKQLISPSGRSIFNRNTDDNEGPLTLAEEGTYRLVISGDNDTTGTFRFRTQLLDATTAIPLDSLVSGTLSVGLGSDFFHVKGTAGQRLYFDSQLSGDITWTLLGPGNVNVASISGFADFEVTIPETQTYFLELRNQSTTNGVPYRFRIVTPESNLTSLTFDAVTVGSLEEPGEQDIFAFNGGIGQRLVYDSQQGSSAGLTYRIVSPSGATVISQEIQNDYFAPLTLTETGSHQLIVDANGDAMGVYRFQLRNALASPNVLVDTPVMGTLNPGDETDSYRIEGTAGQRLRFQFTGTTDYRWSLYAPGDDCVVCNEALSSDAQVSLPGSGDYILTLRGTSPSGTVDYGFTIGLLSDTPVLPSGLPIIQANLLAPSQVADFNFSANAGTMLFFDAIDFDNDSAIAELRDLENQLVFSTSAGNDFGPITLNRSGNYTMRMRNSSAIVEADYHFRLIDLSSAPVMLTNTTISESLSSPFETAIYSIQALAGQRLYLDNRQTNLGAIRQQLIGPSGQTIFDTTTDSGFGPLTITNSGKYTLLVGGTELTSGNYSVRLFDALAAPKVSIGTIVSDAMAQGVEADLFRFDGLANQTIHIQTTSPARNAFAYLYGAGNQRLEAFVVGTSVNVVLPSTSEYTIVVDGNATFTQSYTLRVAAKDETTIPITPRISISTAPGKTTYEYDPAFNQMTSVIDDLGHQSINAIDLVNGNTLSSTQVIGAIGGSDDLVSSFTYTSHGLINTVTDPLGRVTDYDYDTQDRVIKITKAAGTPDQGIVQYGYDTAGNILISEDENGNRTLAEYDALNRVTRITSPDPDGTGPLASPVSLYVYDAHGNLAQVTDVRNNVWKYEYDSRDRLVKSIDPDNSQTIKEYDGNSNLVSSTDSLNQKVRYQYDSRDRQIRSIDPSDGITQYQYNEDNQITSLTDSVGNTTRYEYDARGRLTRRIDPLGSFTDYEWNPNDNLVTMVNRNGLRTEYTYDEVDRRTSELWIDGGNTITYAYDRDSNLVSTGDVYSSLAMTYDTRDRVKTVNNAGTPGVPNVLLTYTYDAVSNRLSTVDTIGGAAGGSNEYSYDALNRVTSISQSGVNVSDKRVDFAFNAMGQFESIRRFSDLAASQLVVSSTYQYDTLNRLISLHHRNASNTDVAFFDFVYDTDDRITRITDIDGATDYAYNERDELTGANHADAGNPDETYAYDTNGNRVSSGRHGAGYVTGPNNRLLSDGTYSYLYDAEGNVTRRTEISSGHYREFQWDHRNRLVVVVDKTAANVETQRVRFTYDTFGRRISKSVDATPLNSVDAAITHFVYNGPDVLLDFVDTDGSGSGPATLAQRYLQGPSVDQVLAQDQGTGDTIWHLTNHLGSVRDLVSNTGTVLNHLKYDSYGTVIAESNPAITTRYRFTGREFDSETSLYFYRARYYDANQGRFISEDPIGFLAADTNLFRYVGSNPISRRDPSGLYDKEFVQKAAWWLDVVGQQGADAHANGANDIALADASTFPFMGQKSIGSAADSFGNAHMLLPRRIDHSRCMSKEQRKELEKGRQNALRHAFWQAALAAIYGSDQAEIIGNAHESWDPDHKAHDTRVDLENNAKARDIGNSLRNEPWFNTLSRSDQFSRVADAVLNAYDQGRLNLTGG